jgi:tRNA threonylcarbamoyladenosine biosynthesis protein TsaE
VSEIQKGTQAGRLCHQDQKTKAVQAHLNPKLVHLEFRTLSEDETIALGEALGRLLRPGDVVALDGELGAGKTRLVRGIAEAMGIDGAQVSSPTYVLVHEYRPVRSGISAGMPPGTSLFHLDAYRLSGSDELDGLGWDRIVDAFGVIVIEWAARIMEALEKEPSLGRVRMQAEGENERRIDVLAPASWMLRPEWARLASQAASDSGRARAEEGWTRCPVTGERVPSDSPTYPFVNEQAKMADLGRWFSGSYVVSREMTEEDMMDPDIGDADSQSR